jgi:hypothetical protein
VAGSCEQEGTLRFHERQGIAWLYGWLLISISRGTQLQEIIILFFSLLACVGCVSVTLLWNISNMVYILWDNLCVGDPSNFCNQKMTRQNSLVYFPVFKQRFRFQKPEHCVWHLLLIVNEKDLWMLKYILLIIFMHLKYYSIKDHYKIM